MNEQTEETPEPNIVEDPTPSATSAGNSAPTPSANDARNPTDSSHSAANATTTPQSPSTSTASRKRRSGLLQRWRHYRRRRREEADLKFERSGDQRENDRICLPETEHLRLPVVWVAELYTPSTVESLLDGIRKLGWDHGQSDDQKVAQWMDKVRAGSVEGTIYLGNVVSPEKQSLFSTRTAALPDGVEICRPIMMSLTPSITVFLAQFILSDVVSSQIETVLRTRYTTYFQDDPANSKLDVVRHVLMGRPLSNRRRINSPRYQQRDAAKSFVANVEGRCIDWIRSYLPGAFSSFKRSAFPTAALIITDQVIPLSDEARDIPAFHGLDLDRSYLAWASASWSGFRLAITDRDAGAARLVVACRRRDVPNGLNEGEHSSDRSIAGEAEQGTAAVLSKWAISCLLQGYRETLAELRDRSAGTRSFHVVRDLKALRSLVRTTFFDIGLAAKEVEVFADGRWYGVQFPKLEQSSSQHAPARLLETLQESQKERARQIQSESSHVSSLLTISSDLSQTISNVWIQRFTLFLTIAALAVAIVALLQQTE